MNEQNLERLLLAHARISGVICAKGGWLPGWNFSIKEAFTDASPIVWKVSAYTDDHVHLRDYFMEADNIVGISVERLT